MLSSTVVNCNLFVLEFGNRLDFTGLVRDRAEHSSWPAFPWSAHCSFHSSLPKAELVFLDMPKCVPENKNKDSVPKDWVQMHSQSNEEYRNRGKL